MQALDVLTAPLAGINLIEASAGTGKTYTITGLYLRLVLEAGCPVNRILVVTYTKAATEELRDRIRRRLVEVREDFMAGRGRDAFTRGLLARCSEPELAERRLTNAVRGFDEAAIYTIHGFCQRVLADSAFASGMLFETELVADERALLQEVVDDFWRREFYDAPALLVHYLLEQNYSPESLARDIRSYVGKPFLEVLGPAPEADEAAIEQDFAKAYARVRQRWPSVHAEVESLLCEHKGLKGSHYPKKSIPVWCALLGEYLAPETANLALFERFKKFTAGHLAGAVKSGHQPPEHDFFRDCDALQNAYERLEAYYRWRLAELRVRLLEFGSAELEIRKRRRRVQSYDDLLINLERGLRGPAGEALAEKLRRRYPAALIDEFQDTDPVQYAIFQRLYAGGDQPVFLVGDPKQAIYSFRGADIFAYLAARRDAARHFTLDVNWRSDPGLLQAVNAVFSTSPRPFLLADIPFQPALAADIQRQPLVIEGDDEPALRLWFVGRDESGKPAGKGVAGELAARATAAEIARLLNLAAENRARIGERALDGGDIAVLVRNHRQARMIRRCLLELGVPSVQQAQDNVFASREARELEWLLKAVLEPGRESWIRAALATDMLGVDGEPLQRLSEDEQEWEACLETFHEYHRRWRERGFIHMFRALLVNENVYRRLLSFRDGERRLTNLLHLAELLQAAAAGQRLGMEGLLKWLAEMRRSPAGENDEQQLRLESDEHLVKIVTVHKSKGLEYPVVFCPFLWDGKLWTERGETFSFHDLNDPTRLFLDFGAPERETHRMYALHEEAAENLRLLYVALTRAKYHCYLVWGAIRDAGTAAPAWLLHPLPANDANTDPLPALGKRFEKLDEPALWQDLQRVAEKADGAVAVQSLPEAAGMPYRPAPSPEPQFLARSLSGPVRGRWWITSFTALAAGQGAELPDYDTVTPREEEVAPEQTHTIFTFPRGARAGSCLHRILERLDFTRPQDLAALTEQTLEAHGFEAEWAATVTRALAGVLATPLAPGGPQLDQVLPERRLNELEFYYPLAGLTPDGLRRLLGGHGFAAAVENLEFNYARGYMKGFIDLVFEADGRFYLVDYKSNWLGPEPAAYRSERLAEVMAREGYYLQYLIYTVALHRYLRTRLPGYEYERCFGGVFYLFLRGMDPALGPDCGVFRDRPSREMVAALDEYFEAVPSSK